MPCLLAIHAVIWSERWVVTSSWLSSVTMLRMSVVIWSIVVRLASVVVSICDRRLLMQVVNLIRDVTWIVVLSAICVLPYFCGFDDLLHGVIVVLLHEQFLFYAQIKCAIDELLNHMGVEIFFVASRIR